MIDCHDIEYRVIVIVRFCECRLLVGEPCYKLRLVDSVAQDPATKLDRAIAASESLKAMPQVPEVSPEKAAALKQAVNSVDSCPC